MKDWDDSNRDGDFRSMPYKVAINKVIIEKGITNIGGYAFNECSSLKNIIIPNTIITIGSYAINKTKNSKMDYSIR